MSVLEVIGLLALLVVVGVAVGHAFGVIQFGVDVDIKRKD